jgi:hypothetical protein
MKSRTVFFAPGRVAPGMTLARATTDRDGKTLLAQGTILDSEMLERLIRRGVETVAVLVLDTRDEETIAEQLQTTESRVNTIFRGESSPARETLRAAILNFRLESTK